MRRAALAALLLAGCSMEPRLPEAALPVPPSWPAGDAYLRQAEAALPTLTYRDIFRDARLQSLVGQALANNRDLRIAAANIVAARAQYRIQRAQRFPQIDATGRASYSDGGRTTTVVNPGTGNPGTGDPGTGDPGTGNPGTGTGGTVVTNSGRSSFSADVGVTAFELDLFGRLASLSRAEQNRYFATEAAARATRLTLVGDIADAWLTYAADASLLKIARDTAASAERSVRLTRARLQGGIAPRTDLRQAEQILETARADVALQTSALAQDVNALRLLVGAEVDSALLPQAIEQVAPTIAELPAGVDSRILLRRPDVVQAEYQLRAANAEIGAARAALFPTISLTGLVGFASSALSALFSDGAFNYSGAANVAYPIFRAGAGRAGVTLTQAQRDAALASYEQAIQVAFREVADGLAVRGTIAERLRATTANTAAAADTYRLADARYRGGVDNFLSSLDAQRSLYTAQRQLVTVRLAQAGNLVTLYRSLGGDQLDPPRETAITPSP